MKGETTEPKSKREMIAELEAQIAAHREDVIEQIRGIVAEHGLDPRAVAEALAPRRRRAVATAAQPASAADPQSGGTTE